MHTDAFSGQIDEKVYRDIAATCYEFEHIITAMGYGYSWLNVAPSRYHRRCPDCIHWAGGSCHIFRQAMTEHDA